jgi:arylesterase/paraoxonase
MIKKLLLAVAFLVLAAGGWFVHLLWSAGQFKTLEPHFDGVCTPITGLVGPEDITIHPESGIAYISASDWRAVSQGKPANGGLYAYDLKSQDPHLIYLSTDAGNHFHPHGISLYVDENGLNSLFVVNHEDGRHRIEIFDLINGKLTHRKTVADPKLISPNDIVAVGPDKFYVSNDHRFTSGFKRGIGGRC